MSAAKQLFVLRHAKSSWDDPGLEDHERPLGPRGRRAVTLLAAHMRATGVRPEQVLCSSARRARETLDRVSLGGEWLIEPELYGASCTDVIKRLRRVPGAMGSVMVIGHNPAMQMLVLSLSGATRPAVADRAAASERTDVQRKFPTGALATLTFACAWSELASGCADLVAYVRPSMLGPDR